MEFETVVKVYVGEDEGKLNVFGELSDRLSKAGPYTALSRAAAVHVDSAVSWRMAGDAGSAAEHTATAARQVADLLQKEGIDVRLLDVQTAPRRPTQEELARLGAPRFRTTLHVRSETPKPDLRLIEELLAGFPAADAEAPGIGRGQYGIEVELEVFARDQEEACWLAESALGEEFADSVANATAEGLS